MTLNQESHPVFSAMPTDLQPLLHRAANPLRRSEILADALASAEGRNALLPLLADGRLDPHRFIPDHYGAWLNALQAFAWVNMNVRTVTETDFDFVHRMREMGLPWVSVDCRGAPIGNPLSPVRLIVKNQSQNGNINRALVQAFISAGDHLHPQQDASYLSLLDGAQQPVF